MIKTSILITGANGEMGHGLIKSLNKNFNKNIITLDINQIDQSIETYILESFKGSILDDKILDAITDKYQITEIYHLAALLSSKAESCPDLAQQVNVGGTVKLLNMAIDQSKNQNTKIKFFFPSSIAVYGLKGLKNKIKAGKITEQEHCFPETMYGCNKLYCEHLGRYYSLYYKSGSIDFRSIRFPGLISAHTMPTGGTTDYAPEMLHAAATNKQYTCFVGENTKLPFMMMDDAIDAIIKLMETDQKYLTEMIYNIGSFSVSALEFKNIINKEFKSAKIIFKVNEKKQAMVNSWPEDVDYSCAKKDWNFSPKLNFEKSFLDYLIPSVRRKYE